MSVIPRAKDIQDIDLYKRIADSEGVSVKIAKFMFRFFKPAPLSPFRVCFVASGGGGAWDIRAKQISSTRRNWKATLDFRSISFRDFDIFVVVKHGTPEMIHHLKTMNKIVIYDVIDSWKQPEDGLKYTDLPSVRNLFKDKWSAMPFDAAIYPNQQMQKDLEDLVPLATHIYHHFRPNLKPINIREKVMRVGYEGVPGYLGDWLPIILRLCRDRNIKFVVNPAFYRSLDIVLAARSGPHDSFLANRYKSNVKLANCYGAGIPCLASSKEISYKETDDGNVSFFSSAQDLEHQLDHLLDYKTRSKIHQSFLNKRAEFSLESIVDKYETFFSTVTRNIIPKPY